MSFQTNCFYSPLFLLPRPWKRGPTTENPLERAPSNLPSGVPAITSSSLKNEKYWQPGKPWLNKVVFRTIPDPQTRYASLVSGEIDVISIDRGHLIHKAEDDPELTVYPSQVNGAEIILINTTRPPLDDIRVRRALALANNQEQHVKMVYGNTVPLVHHPFGKQFACADDDYPEHDLEKAKQLMADYGKPVEIELLHSNTSRGRSIGELQQQLYKEIGVQSKTGGPEPRSAHDESRAERLSTGHLAHPAVRGLRPQTLRQVSFAKSGELYRLCESRNGSICSRCSESKPIRQSARRCFAKSPEQINRDVPILYRGGRRYHIITRKKIRDMMDSPGFQHRSGIGLGG